MPTPEQDLAFVQTGLEELETYLLSDELFWPLAGPASLPRLTIGGLLLAMRRVQGRSPAAAIRAEAALDLVRSKWRSAWEKKARREVHARIALWTNYLADARQTPGMQDESYPQQVQVRAMLQLLAGELSEVLPGLPVLADLDIVLRSTWLPGAFAWDADLQAIFPREEFWFLYGTLK